VTASGLSHPIPAKPATHPRRALAGACLAHALHDGFTDMIYVLLPVWQVQFGLGYGALAGLRGIYTATMAALQIPSTRLAERGFGARGVLVLGTMLAAAGYGLAGLSGSLSGLCLALAVAGAGSSTQHPLASAIVSRAYQEGARGPLGTYNFAGDVGKASVPTAVALILTVLPWRGALGLVAAAGLVVAALVFWLLPAGAGSATAASPHAAESRGNARGGFGLLLAIGILDSAVRMAFLLFLPFLLQQKGAGLPTVGLALGLTFAGGAAGKFTCGWLGARFGLLATVVMLPLAPTLVLLPLLGVMLNGTSSVLYGTVPELVPRHDTERAFARFYTGTIGSGALAPMLYGLLGDAVGPTWAAAAAAFTALATVPLAILLAPHLRRLP
jgi:FSR family fosmidomycin resistance protein-like MFS transporter